MRFIHTADWQLGKPFGRFETVTRTALTEARFDAIDAIGRAAQEQGVGHVLVAGDVFDTEGPDERTIIQAVTRMERANCRWWLLPGNHDFARNGGLWDRVRRRGALKIVVLAEYTPHEIEPGVWLLPAPLLHRHTHDDPTEGFDRMETPGARLRIGLAHGSIRDFGTQGEAKNLLPPDRARRSGLDYLALGDWHGTLRVDARTWYSGTPEVDRFAKDRERDDPGHCLLVDLEPDAEPVVTPLTTGRYRWLSRDWTVADAVSFESLCTDLLATCDPAATLLQLSLSGIIPLTDRVAMLRRIEDMTHQLRYLDTRDGNLMAKPSEEDLAALSTEGMIGRAGALLRAKIEAGGTDAHYARRALERLFVETLRETPELGQEGA